MTQKMQGKSQENASPVDQLTRRLVKTGGALALLSSMGFFIYCAYAGIILGGGSSQIFTGVACLFLVLIGCIIIEKIVIKDPEHSTDPPDNESGGF
jgi:hypothetical protein